MTEAIALAAELRQELGTGPARALRRQGRVPAIIYGAGKQPLSVSIEEKEITKLYRKPHFISALIQLEIGENKYNVLPKSVVLHPITDIVRHVDFVFLEDQMQKMEVPIVFEGKERATGVKRGGYFNIVKRRLKLICHVDKLPRCITINVSNMQIGQSLKTSDITLPEGCELLNKSNLVIASIIGRAGKAETEEAVENKA